MPYEIFINYRRDDALMEAAWLYKILVSFLGEARVFFDKHEIKGGEEWRNKLMDGAGKSTVVLSLIGPKWLKAQNKDNFKRRLDIEDDWVRQELAIALKDARDRDEARKTDASIPIKIIIPILINGAGIPDKKAMLTADIAGIDGRQYLRLDTTDPNPFVFDLHKRLTELSFAPSQPFDPKLIPSPYDLLDYPLPNSYKRPINPYTGLGYFTKDDARIFFGRSTALYEFFRKIEQSSRNLILFTGQSGVGKSSLLNAGLIPRLETKFHILPFRRNKDNGFFSCFSSIREAFAQDSDKPQAKLIILDQAEEMITDPNTSLPDEQQQFVIGLYKLLTDFPDIKVILSFRKEYQLEFETLLDKAALDYDKFYLQPLNKEEVREAVVGVTRLKDLNDKYEIAFEPGLADQITADFNSNGVTQNTPMLQLLLRNMWDEAASTNDRPRVFNGALYGKYRQDTYENMLNAQINKIRETLASVVDSGLVLEILHYFVSDSGTSKQCQDADFEKDFSHINGILGLLNDLKRLYLLSNGNVSGTTRLSTDTLAAAVTSQFSQSSKPAQRATRALTNALESNELLSRMQLSVVLAGRNARPALQEREQILLDKSLDRHYIAIILDLLGQNKLEGSFALAREEFVRRGKSALADKVDLQQLTWQDIRAKRNGGVISYESARTERAAIRNDFVQIIQSLTEEETLHAVQEILGYLVSGDLEHGMELLSDTAELYFRPEQNNVVKTIRAQYDELLEEWKSYLINNEDYFKVSSKILHQVLDEMLMPILFSRQDGWRKQENLYLDSVLGKFYQWAEQKKCPSIIISERSTEFYEPKDAAVFFTIVAVYTEIWDAYLKGLLMDSEYNVLLKRVERGVHAAKLLLKKTDLSRQAKIGRQQTENTLEVKSDSLYKLLTNNDIESVFWKIGKSGDFESIKDVSMYSSGLARITLQYDLLQLSFQEYIDARRKTIESVFDLIGSHEKPAPSDLVFDPSAFRKLIEEHVSNGTGDQVLNYDTILAFNPDEPTFKMLVCTGAYLNELRTQFKESLISNTVFLFNQSCISAILLDLKEKPVEETSLVLLDEASKLAGTDSLEKISQYVAGGELDNAMVVLYRYDQDICQNRFQSVIMATYNQYSNLIYRYNIGIMEFDNYMIEKNKIAQQIMTIRDEMD